MGVLYTFLMGLVLTIFTYYLVRTILEKALLNKIRVIYKLLGDFKQIDTDLENELKEFSIDQAQKDVELWADERNRNVKELIELEQYRKSFVGNISHELKTPLFAIQGYLVTLLEGGIYDKSINEKYLRKAVNNVDRLQNIVDDLETIHQLESDKIVLNIEDFDIRALCMEILDDLKFQAEEKSINLKINDDSNNPLFVKADKEKIRHVLYNLLFNSIKYGKKGGSVSVDLDSLDEKMVVAVTDDGIGIEDKHIPFLFDRFYRVEQSRSRKAGGSGLGLSIVKHILEAHDQTVTANSALGKGSTFRFTLSKA